MMLLVPMAKNSRLPSHPGLCPGVSPQPVEVCVFFGKLIMFTEHFCHVLTPSLVGGAGDERICCARVQTGVSVARTCVSAMIV